MSEDPPRGKFQLRSSLQHLRQSRRLVAIIAGTAIALLSFIVFGQSSETTDNATIDARTTAISSQVSGVVSTVAVNDNQMVEAGDLLIELDPAPQQVLVDQAQATVEVAQAELAKVQVKTDMTPLEATERLTRSQAEARQAQALSRAARAGIAKFVAQHQAAQARLAHAQSEIERQTFLRKRGAITDAELEQARLQLDLAKTEEQRSRAELSDAKADRQGAIGGVQVAQSQLAVVSADRSMDSATQEMILAQARVKQTLAALAKAKLELSYTKIRAPSRGWLTRRSVEVGQAVSPDMLLFAIVSPDDVWVDANFKESQIARLHAGQSAKIFVDVYDKEFMAQVESIAPVSASRFSLLPAENASGNFVKVVQRMAVRLRFTPLPELALRPGMSATATVSTSK